MHCERYREIIIFPLLLHLFGPQQFRKVHIGRGSRQITPESDATVEALVELTAFICHECSVLPLHTAEVEAFVEAQRWYAVLWSTRLFISHTQPLLSSATMSQQASASGHPTTFNTNVNRAKTKKWVEAKSYSYDGDDWGDVDDYDEYGGYDEPAPAPAPESKPTGLRQRGQSASQMPQDPYSARQDPYQSPVDTRLHGNVGGLPDRQQQQHHYGSRSVTNPQIQPPSMRRNNSFDPEDERRAFSAGGPPQSIGNTAVVTQPPAHYNQGQNIAAHDFQSGQKHPNPPPQGQPSLVQTPGHPSIDEAARYGGQPPQQQQTGIYQSIHPDQPQQSSMGNRTQSMASTNSALDFHNRRDFSPSAVPPPLQTRGSPSPHSRSSTTHPPRKSSVSQETAPTSPFGTQAQPMTETEDTEKDMPSTRDRAASGASKALPFVRPADIYRRMQEEKEKERQSQESARPSMDTLMGKSNERPDLGSSRDSEAGQRLKPTLDPVTERRSEYALEGVDLNEEPKSEERRLTTSKKFELPKRISTPSGQGASSSLQPMLPDVSRVSGFGESFFGSTSGSGEPSREPFLDFAGASTTASAQPDSNRATPGKDLRNQPSLGFTSAVHEAFDRAEDQVPPTPSSAAGSMVGRSTSGGTSAVSPIISRGPSTSTPNWNSKLPGIDDVTTPTKVDTREGSNSRPLSADSLGTPNQIIRKPSPSPPIATRPQSTDLPSPSFVPGHRRDLSTPSPDNSPARTPALEVNRHLRQPQEVELAAATPTDPNFSQNSSSNASEVAEQKPTSTQASGMASRGRSDLQLDTQPMVQDLSKKADSGGSPIRYPQNYLRTRTDSGSSSRVRDLADKFESGSRPGSAHSTTAPRTSLFGNNMQKDDLVPPRPLADRMESFRPHLPGGWESSVSITPAAALRRPEPTVNRTQPDSSATDFNPSKGIALPADQGSSSLSQVKDASQEAFTAVAAAGTALAGAFAAAVGMDHDNESEASVAETRSKEQLEEKGSPHAGVATRKRNVSVNTVVNPEATKPYLLNPMADEASTAAPTPLPKDTPLHPTDSHRPDYFSPSQIQERTDSADDSADLSEGIALAKRPSMLPSLSTGTSTPQYESDRLRREIVRELSPMHASEPTTAQSDFSNYDEASRFSTNQSLPRPGHESGVLPREYESYWNDANSDDDTSHFSTEPGRLENATTAHRQHGAAVVSEPLRPRHVEQGLPVRDALHLDRETQDAPTDPRSIGEGPRDRPQILQHRFSWEQPLQSPQPITADQNMIHQASSAPVSDVLRSPTSDVVREDPDVPVSDFLRSAVYPKGQFFEPKDDPEASQMSTLPNVEAALGDDDPRLHDRDASFPEMQTLMQHDEIAGVEGELPGHRQGVEAVPLSSIEGHPEQIYSGYNDGTVHTGQQSPVLQSGLMRDVEPSPIEPSLPEPPVHEPSGTFGIQHNEAPPLPPPNSQPKIAAFREILALKSPSDRIRAYDETREQFGNLNTGLSHWLAITANELPEHADLFVGSARRPTFQSHKPSPSRIKLGGLLQSGGLSTQSHSNTPPSVPDSAPGNASPYGYSPSTGPSGKISSQQVQAKGKDLLHTAGVFGGKANVAAKGLFSKGKNKLRGSSGVEKAFPAPPQPFSPEPRGMQMQPRYIEEQPITQSASRATTSSHAQTPQHLPADNHRATDYPTVPPRQDTSATIIRVDHKLANKESPYQHVDSHQAAVPPLSQGSLPWPQSSEQKSPRDTPSLESFTESQEGDDERSEESAPTTQEHLPRASSLYLEGIANHRQSRSPQSPVTMNNDSRNSVKERSLGGSNVGHPKEVQTPRSASSSIQTPTQATFASGGQTASKAGSPGTNDGASLQHRRGAESSPRSASQPPSVFSAQMLSKDRRSQEPEAEPRFSHDSVSAYHTAVSGDHISHFQLASVSPYSQGSTDVNLPHQSEFYQRRSPAHTQNGRAVSLTRDPLKPQTLSQEYPSRGPSIDGDTGRVDLDHPPSPLTPRQPTNYGAAEQRGRSGPIHYGIDHDFDRPSDTERSRSRSPSYFKGLQDSRRSQDSRPSLDPNILDHPAFRAVAEGNGMPEQDYRAHMTREEYSTPRQQTAAQMLVGGGPNPEKHPESKSRSRRGSRSSAFFKAFTSPSKADHPPLPNAPVSQASSSSRDSPAVGDRRSKRVSIFRPRSVNMGSGSGDSRSKENMAPWDASTQDSYTQNTHQVGPTTTPGPVQEDTASRGVSSKLSKKLQRASTSVKPEPESGKKKRFSAIGTLFGGRKRQSRQSSTLQSQLPPQQSFQQSHPPPTQQHDPYSVVEPQRSERYDYGSPREELIQPPREGYYAPGRQGGGSPHSGSRPRGPSYSSKAPDAPAYVQDSALRVHQLMSPVEQPPNAGLPRTSATFPQQRSPQHSVSSAPRSSTSNQPKTGEAFPRPSNEQTKPPGNSWTRLSTHARSKSRPEPAHPPSTGPLSSPPPQPHGPMPPSNTPATARRSFQAPVRPISPTPPPPPPKDNWHRPRPHDSASLSPSQLTRHSRAPSQSSPRPAASTPKHHSLPPLQTDVHGGSSRNKTAIGPGRTLTPEEKRRSRQLEIERASIPPPPPLQLRQRSPAGEEPRGYRGGDEDEEPVVMSATSFPGQMWQPSYAHWDE